jgi:hypothetical protein
MMICSLVVCRKSKLIVGRVISSNNPSCQRRPNERAHQLLVHRCAIVNRTMQKLLLLLLLLRKRNYKPAMYGWMMSRPSLYVGGVWVWGGLILIRSINDICA